MDDQASTFAETPGDGEELVAMLERTKGELNTRMGIRLLDASPERLVGTMPVDGNRQPYGLLHGGASCVLAETLGSVLAALNAPAGWQAVGVDINATHHRAALDGQVTGTATVLQAGRTMVTSSIEVHDEQGRRICTARLTCLLRPARE